MTTKSKMILSFTALVIFAIVAATMASERTGDLLVTISIVGGGLVYIVIVGLGFSLILKQNEEKVAKKEGRDGLDIDE